MNSDNNEPLIDIESIYKMLFNEEKYVLEFAEASIQSFSEFSEHYTIFLLNKDMENLRKAGHKIKPVAQMLDVGEILVEYENGKQMLIDGKPEKELNKSAEKIQVICGKVLNEFEQIKKNLK